MRVSIQVKAEGQVMFLGHAPDLDSRWQTVILTDSLPFCLKDMIAMKLGFQCMRQEDAVALVREQECVDHVLTVNRVLLDSWKLSAAQKVLLRYNSSLTRNRSCPLLIKRSNGHDGVPMSKDIPLYRALMGNFPWTMHGIKSGSGSSGEPSWLILIGKQGKLRCHCLTCMMGMILAPTTNSGIFY